MVDTSQVGTTHNIGVLTNPAILLLSYVWLCRNLGRSDPLQKLVRGLSSASIKKDDTNSLYFEGFMVRLQVYILGDVLSIVNHLVVAELPSSALVSSSTLVLTPSEVHPQNAIPSGSLHTAIYCPTLSPKQSTMFFL